MTKLFELLPALYRLRDSNLAQSQGARGPLASLLMLVEEQFAVLSENLDQLYDDQFIETCAPWVIPYIGDLIGYQAVNGIAPAVSSPRAEIANTISFRRRKGTVLAMEQLARDVTGWGAHAAELFQVLAGTQYMNHPRLHNHYAPDLRLWKNRLYLNSAFERTAHTVEVRRIATGGGRYNVQNIGIFVWSLNAYSLTLSPATAVPPTTSQAAAALCFRFSPLGIDMPLFNNPVSQGADITAASGPINVPARLRRLILCDDLQKGADAAYYGEGNSLALYLGGQLLNANQIQVCNLSGADGSWINLPAANSRYLASVDPESGRIALPAPASGTPPSLQTSFYYGFNADMAGGEYARQSTFAIQTTQGEEVWPYPGNPAQYSTLQDAIAFALARLPVVGRVAVEITNSGVYTVPALTVDLPSNTTIELRAADGSRPTLILAGEITASGAASSLLALNGLVIQSGVHAPVDRPDGATPNQISLSVTHCTLVPNSSQPSLLLEAPGLRLTVSKSILGAMRLSGLVTVTIADSILDATSLSAVAYSALDGSGAGGALTMTGCTVVGRIHATLLSLVSNSIIWASSGVAAIPPVWSDRRQAGCVRFSYLPEGSVTPGQFECVQQGSQSQSLFVSLQYGDPGYSKLLTSTPDAVRRGADDGGEMGAFHFLLAPLRENDLRVRLREYIPAGLEFGIIYEN